MTRIINTILFAAFLLVFIASNTIPQAKSSIETPFGSYVNEKNSPSDWIKKENIHVFNERIVIDLKNAEWAEFENTNSMDPVLDTETNTLELKPISPEELKVGDIVSYRSIFSKGIIIHRIIEIGSDKNGWYAIIKGDNNPIKDPGKVRFSQIEGVVVAVFY